MTCAANASLISTRSMSEIAIPARRSACLDASTGPRPMISGDSALTPVDTIRASGVIPSSAARRSLITITAAAPSFSGQQLPAVTVPSGRNTGFSEATFGQVLRPHAELVLLLPGDAPQLRDVLGGLAHSDVHVRDRAVVPGVVPDEA